MALVVVTEPSAEPITLEEAKRHLRVDDLPGSPAEHPEDAEIAALVTAARRHAEQFCRRAFIETAYRYTLDRFPCSGLSVWSDFWGLHHNLGSSVIHLPVGRLMAVESMQYVDTDGVTQTLAPSDYQVDADSEPPRLAPAHGESWPSTRNVLSAVTILFTAGYGSDASKVPQDIKSAIKLIAGDLYELREDTNVGNIVTPIPNGAERLLWPHRIWPL